MLIKLNEKSLNFQLSKSTQITNSKKFDLRIYIIIASVDPFVVLYQLGFIRKCIVNYDLDFKKFDQR